MPIRYEGTEDEKRSLNAYVKLMRAAESVTARVHRHLAGVKLTETQFGVLEAIHHLGPLSQKEIGKKLLKSRGNITTVVDNLERRRLVKRERATGDRRVVRVHLTDEGERLIAGIFPCHAAGIVEEMAVLTEAEQKELDRLCRKLGLGRTTASAHPRGARVRKEEFQS